MQTFHLFQYFLIILTQSMQNTTEILHETFEILMTLGLMDVNILIKDEVSTLWSLHFYKPYSKDCNSFEIVKLDTFSSKNYTNELDISFKHIFPRKHFTFCGCLLYISTFSFEPFVIIRDGANGSTIYDGVDVIIVNEISKTLNLIPLFIQKNRGMVYKNGTSTGAIKMVSCQENLKLNSVLNCDEYLL